MQPVQRSKVVKGKKEWVRVGRGAGPQSARAAGSAGAARRERDGRLQPAALQGHRVPRRPAPRTPRTRAPTSASLFCNLHSGHGADT
ncbi:hypothetical protein EVAR_50576_1 [Eumeta japonica]|uniref:Uncharacterized protein n=1 Tax=Eumeta variegata TaxID=151549 RepID=A0A4C1YAG7_EUMVA|nr:hypothetical protein EVAR_50576_1 [Eumeta japonica]